MNRIAGKRGLRKSPPRPELRASLFMAEIPIQPAKGDVTGGITAFGMDHNDQYGCCGPAATDHINMCKTLAGALASGYDAANAITAAAAVSGQLLPGAPGVLPAYFAYGIAQGEPGPDPDEGVDNDSWLAYCFKQGWIDWYCQLDPTNANEIRWGVNEAKGVLLGVELNDQAEQQFENDQPWNVGPGDEPDPNEGHDIAVVKYGQPGLEVVTWGALQHTTIRWDEAEEQVWDAWIFGTTTDAERLGINYSALLATITELGGTEKAA